MLRDCIINGDGNSSTALPQMSLTPNHSRVATRATVSIAIADKAAP